ncbi:MAG: MoaD/ThiS family protein [Pirellulaceae bacterium]
MSASIDVHLPTTLRHYCEIHSPVSVDAVDIQSALEDLQRNYPSLYQSICDETGTVRRHINLFVNATWVPVSDAGGLAMQLKQGDVLTIWPAVSGG